jgi:tetratricopeptide (TPR) repeat protein
VFGWSYRQLDASAARLFRRLGLHPGHDISVHAAARLADVPTGQARKLLRDLVRRGLLIEPRPGRHVFHDLLRAYAAGQAEMADSSAERQAALTRLFGDYLAMAGAAMDTLAPGERDYRPAVGPPDADAPPVTTHSAARNWLDAERVNLIAVAGHAARSGWPNHAIRFSAILFRYLDDGPVTDVHALHSSALEAARQTNDPVAQADALRRRCAVDFRQGHYQQAADQLAQALIIYRDAGDQQGQGRTLGNIGLVLRAQGRYAEALSHQRQALALAHQTGDRPGQAFVRNTLGTTLCRLGRYAEAAGHFGQALALYRELKDRGNEASVLDNLGVALHREGRLTEAEQHHELAVAIYREVGCRYGEAHALTHMGASVHAGGRYQLAADCHRQALALYEAEGHPAGQAEALNGLGDALAALGHPGSARIEYERALALAIEVTERRQQARAHDGLGHVHLAIGDTGRAGEHWERALAHYAEMGFPEADEVRVALDVLREKVQS